MSTFFEKHPHLKARHDAYLAKRIEHRKAFNAVMASLDEEAHRYGPPPDQPNLDEIIRSALKGPSISMSVEEALALLKGAEPLHRDAPP